MTGLAGDSTFGLRMATKASRTAATDKASSSTGARATSRTTTSRASAPARPTLSFSRTNAIWLGAAAVSIAIGYFLLAGGSETIAPILLVLGYCVLLPIGIIKK
ncbi:MAG TPA: hypothetical protein VJ788_06410 [Gemmatimonadota bacterium]|nr:hypothetical protein [Gemmatimonadota bacterium]